MDERVWELAAELAEKENASGVALASKKALPSSDLTPDQYKAVDCEECEEPLPEFRKQKGLVLCTHCQSIKERRKY